MFRAGQPRTPGHPGVQRERPALDPRSPARVGSSLASHHSSTPAHLRAAPPSLALYPQRGELPVAELEPELAAKTGERTVFYNKGL